MLISFSFWTTASALPRLLFGGDVKLSVVPWRVHVECVFTMWKVSSPIALIVTGGPP